MERLLIIDDDAELCSLLKELLEGDGFEVGIASDGTTGLERASSGEFSLVILDVMLPLMNGLDVLRQLRLTSSVPVLLLTARGSDIDRIVGLELGADDYLPKPFHPRELLARLRAVLRRTSSGTAAQESKLVVGDVVLDSSRRTVTRDGCDVPLTTVEFNVLAVLMRAVGTVVTRDDLSQQALGRKPSILDRSIDVHVSKIRKKLSVDIQKPDPIRTLRGVGYLYALPVTEEART
jgi:two-component system response regulator CpxR